MPTMLRISLAMAWSVWCGLAPGVWAASDTSRPVPRAIVVAPAGAPTTYAVRDQDGRIVTVDVPPLRSPALQGREPTQGTVEATVLTVNGETNHVTVQTDAGQTLVLTLTPEAIRGLRVGDHFSLSITQRSWQ